MADEIYSERQGIIRPLDHEDIGDVFWQAFVVTLNKMTTESFFAEAFPEECSDRGGNIVAGGSSYARGILLEAEVGNVDLRWTYDSEVPDTFAILDTIEFFARHVSKPTWSFYHDYARHDHVGVFDRVAGLSEYRRTVNRLLLRCGHPYELDENGQVQHIGDPVLSEVVTGGNFHTGDRELDGLLRTAVEKYRDPSPDIRREGLEKLWDAWERLKTILDADKKKGIGLLLDHAVPELRLRAEIDQEGQDLTDIGNNFMIRHTETTKTKLESDDHVEYLFHRLFALVYMLLKTTGRASA